MTDRGRGGRLADYCLLSFESVSVGFHEFNDVRDEHCKDDQIMRTTRALRKMIMKRMYFEVNQLFSFQIVED